MSQKARITYRFDNPSPKPVRPSKDQAGTVHTPGPMLQGPLPRAVELVVPSDGETVGKKELPIVIPMPEQLTFIREQDLPPWVSPFQDDAYALEKLIRESEPPADRYRKNEAKQEARSLPDNGRPSHIELGEQDGSMRLEPAPVHKTQDYKEWSPSPAIRRHSVGPSWFKVFASVAGAIATGALFGYMALSLFAGEGAPPAGTTELPADAKIEDGMAVPQPTDGTIGSPPPVDKSTLTDALVPGGTYYMLQYGVFSNEEGMTAALDELRQKGLAAASSTGDGYRVFAGMGMNRNSAVMLSEQLGNSEVYLKEISVPEVSRLPFVGDARQAEQFFEQTGDLIRLFNELTLTQLSQKTPERLQERDVQVWRAAHQQWTATAAATAGAWDASAKGSAESLVTRLQTAAVSLEEYDKNPSRAHLWTAQSALMEAVIIQKDWLAQIDALS